MDIVGLLPVELVHQIFLLIIEDLPKCMRVSKAWNHLLQSDSLWRLILQQRVTISVYNDAMKEYSKKNVWVLPRVCCNEVPHSRQLFLELCGARKEFENPMHIMKRTLKASSADHEGQDIDKTIDHSQFTFWSSKGSENRDNIEYLDYALDGNCIVTQVSIKPFLAHYQRGLPVYAPLMVSFEISTNVDFDQTVNSKLYTMVNTPEHQVFDLEPVMIGSYFRIYLHGHRSTQTSNLNLIQMIICIILLWKESCLMGSTHTVLLHILCSVR
jgi:hypothetical protein